MKHNFTKKYLNALDANGKREINIQDAGQTGLAVRVRDTGIKSFIVRYKLNGKDVRTTLGKYPSMTIDQARKAAREALNKFSDGINPNSQKKADKAKNTTLMQCFEDYLTVNHKLARSTIASYGVSVNQYMKDWQSKPLLSISRDMVEKRHLLIGEKSPTRANHCMRLLRALFNFAHGEYEDEKGTPLFIHNPVARISHKKLWFNETRRSTFIKAKDLPTWYQAVTTLPEWTESSLANADSIRDYFLLLLLTGLRRTECAMIQKSWIDVDDRSLTIPSSITKNGVEHQLPLSNFLMKIVNARMGMEGDYLFSGKSPSDHIKEPKRMINQIRKRTEVYFTCHDLRRTFITNAEGLGHSGYTLKRLLNHRNKDDVTDGYIITDVESLRPVMQSITDRLIGLATSGDESNVVRIHA